VIYEHKTHNAGLCDGSGLSHRVHMGYFSALEG
jgi:hypothetical protein